MARDQNACRAHALKFGAIKVFALDRWLNLCRILPQSRGICRSLLPNLTLHLFQLLPGAVVARRRNALVLSSFRIRMLV